MKIGIIADIHANHVALRAVYKYFCDNKITIVCILGDILTDCPNPNATMQFLKKFERKFRVYYVKGNREEYIQNIVNQDMDEENLTSLNGSIYYTVKNMKKKYLKKLAKMPYANIAIFDEYPNIFMAHATPINTRERLMPNDLNTNIYLDNSFCDYILCAHTHKQFIYNYDGKTLINPGSLGLFCGSKTADFATLTLENNGWVPKLHQIEYDHEQLLLDFAKSNIISYGKTYTQVVIDSFDSGDLKTTQLIELGIKLADNKAVKEEHFIKAYEMLKAEQ